MNISGGGSSGGGGAASFTAEIVIKNASGFGSSAGGIRKLTTIITSTGTDITYANSASAGTTFTINTTGVYFISYSDGNSTGEQYSGISLNATSGEQNDIISNIADTKILAMTLAQGITNKTTIRSLTAGDIVRPHGSGAGDYTTEGVFFHIKRIG